MTDFAILVMVQAMAQLPATIAAILAWIQSSKVHTLVNSAQDAWKARENAQGQREGRLEEREGRAGALDHTDALGEILKRLESIEERFTRSSKNK